MSWRNTYYLFYQNPSTVRARNLKLGQNYPLRHLRKYTKSFLLPLADFVGNIEKYKSCLYQSTDAKLLLFVISSKCQGFTLWRVCCAMSRMYGRIQYMLYNIKKFRFFMNVVKKQFSLPTRFKYFYWAKLRQGENQKTYTINFRALLFTTLNHCTKKNCIQCLNI